MSWLGGVALLRSVCPQSRSTTRNVTASSPIPLSMHALHLSEFGAPRLRCPRSRGHFAWRLRAVVLLSGPEDLALESCLRCEPLAIRRPTSRCHADRAGYDRTGPGCSNDDVPSAEFERGELRPGGDRGARLRASARIWGPECSPATTPGVRSESRPLVGARYFPRCHTCVTCFGSSMETRVVDAKRGESAIPQLGSRRDGSR